MRIIRRILPVTALAAALLGLAVGTAGAEGRQVPAGGAGNGPAAAPARAGLSVVVAPRMARPGQPVFVLARYGPGWSGLLGGAHDVATGGSTAAGGCVASDGDPGDQGTITPTASTGGSDGSQAPAPGGVLTPTASTTTFTVDFGDGGGPAAVPGVQHGVNAFATTRHPYAAAGSYKVTVTATLTDGSTLTATEPVTVAGGDNGRLDGDDRYGTSQAVSDQEFPTPCSAPAAVLTSGLSFPDALAAAPLAVELHGPVLLTDPTTLPQSTASELSRVLASGATVYVLGGAQAVSDQVVAQVGGLGFTVVRIAGTDRVATALDVATKVSGAPSQVFVAGSRDFPDALAAAAAAARVGAPVVLTDPDQLSAPVAAWLTGLAAKPAVTVVGGKKAVSDGVLASLQALGLDVTRVAGIDRFESSAQIAERSFSAPGSVTIVTGGNFADALSAAPSAASSGGPVLLVGTTLPPSVAHYLAAHASTIKDVFVVGGAGAVPDGVVSAVNAALGR